MLLLNKMKKVTIHLLRTLVVVACFAGLTPFASQTPASSFTRTDTMITMRDGVKLHTQVYAPANAGERLPILLLRTPYGIGDASPGTVIESVTGIVGRRLHCRPSGHSREI